MGEIKIDIPRDLEAAFEEAFPGEDKAQAILGLIHAELARRHHGDAVPERSFEDMVLWTSPSG
jgi:hypothetical protein